MSISFKAIYENGVIRPLEPVDLHEKQELFVTVNGKSEVLDDEQEESAYDMALRLGLIGMIKDAPPDLSTNKKYFEGFGDSE